MTRTGTLTLADFLLARIAEDYDVAWGAAPSPWREGEWDGRHDGRREVLDRHGDVTAACYYGGTYGHVLRFDPTRTLADIEAKRRIVAEHQTRTSNLVGIMEPEGGVRSPSDFEAIVGGRRSCRACRLQYPDGDCLTLRLLALPYANHADYLPEWRVDG